MAENSIKPFTMTTAGFITPMITGLLSASSSGLILYIISRSQQKLSTTYHRIMALMSFFDICSSLFIALGTIMMPTDNVFPFAGPMLGNQASCSAQGWLIIFGYVGAAAMNACLAWYFVCRIALKIDFVKVRKRIEPIMYIYTMILSLFAPSFYLSKDLLNSTPYDSFCTIAPHAELCWGSNGYNWNLCQWSKADIHEFDRYVKVAVFILLTQFILILACMSIILWTVCRNHKEIRALTIEDNQHMNSYPTFEIDIEEYPSSPDDGGHDVELDIDKVQQMNQLRYSRVLIFQALMYIGAYMLTWSWNFLSAQLYISSFVLDAVNCVLFPLQGFWNLSIFLYDKVYLIRQSKCRTSFFQDVKQILVSPRDTPIVVLYNLSTVVIEPRDENIVEEEPEKPDADLSSKNSDFVGISKLHGDFSLEEIDGISKLSGDFSLGKSSVGFSWKVSSTSMVLDEEENRQWNFINHRKSWNQLRKELDKSNGTNSNLSGAVPMASNEEATLHTKSAYTEVEP